MYRVGLGCNSEQPLLKSSLILQHDNSNNIWGTTKDCKYIVVTSFNLAPEPPRYLKFNIN